MIGRPILVGAVWAMGASAAALASDQPPIEGFGATGIVAPTSLVPGSSFGRGMAASGARLWVGAQGYYSTLVGQPGACYLLEPDAWGTWLPTLTLHAAVPAPYDGFGAAVACDRSRVAIGSPTAGAGRVEIRTIDDAGQVDLEATLEGLGYGDRFGAALALGGDRLVIGAPFADSVGTDAGMVSIYRRDASGWTLEATLVAPGGGPLEEFGAALAIDATGSSLVVGAPYGKGGGVLFSGRAFAFAREGETWSFVQAIEPPEPQTLGGFASIMAMAASGADLAIGAPESGVPAKSGRVTILRREAGRWVATTVLPGAAASSRFGAALAWQGDLLAIAASGQQRLAIERRIDGGWSELVAMPTPSGMVPGDGLAFTDAGIAIGASNAGVSLAQAAGCAATFRLSSPAGGILDDCDGDGEPNGAEVMHGASDCDGDFVPDACELPAGDCDADGVLDSCQLLATAAYPGSLDNGYACSLLPDGPYEVAIMNRFQVPTGGVGLLDAIELRMVAIEPGASFRVAVWGDASGVGQPAGAELLFESPLDLAITSWSQRVPLPGVAVGEPGDFYFAGIVWTVPTASQTSALSSCSGADTIPAGFFAVSTIPLDLAHLDAAIVGPLTWLGTAYHGPPRIGAVLRLAADANGDGVLDACVCPADLNHDGTVGPGDLAILLGAWSTAAGDLDGDGTTGPGDLAVLLGAWGGC